MYKVIKYFTDLQDGKYAYNVGDEFPHDGKEVSPERLKELSTKKNKRGVALIEEVKDEPLPFTEDEPVDEPVVEEKPVEKPKPKRGKKKG